jgi:aspartokinase
MNQGTEFEKPRGVSSVEVRPGFSQVHVSTLQGDVMEERLRVLLAIADREISIDFLKLTPGGLSFLVPEDRSADVEAALRPLGTQFTVRQERSILLVHAVNIRDEEGLIAKIVERAIASGATIDHVSDMHDRMLMVMEQGDAQRVAESFRGELMEAVHAN